MAIGSSFGGVVLVLKERAVTFKKTKAYKLYDTDLKSPFSQRKALYNSFQDWNLIPPPPTFVDV